MIKIKVLKSDDKELINKVLHLECLDESKMLWHCEKTKLEIIDTWEELILIEKLSKEKNCYVFYDLHLFYQTETDLKFIDEVKLIPNK